MSNNCLKCSSQFPSAHRLCIYYQKLQNNKEKQQIIMFKKVEPTNF